MKYSLMSSHVNFNRLKPFILLTFISILGGCSQSDTETDLLNKPNGSFYDGSNNLAFFDESQHKKHPDIGQIFMIDHYGMSPTPISSISRFIKEKNLGAVIFWNPKNNSAQETKQLILSYSKTAKAFNNVDIFYAVDHEGAGYQRLSAAHGFKNLMMPRQLGDLMSDSTNSNPDTCYSFAHDIAEEFSSIGMNMALSTVADLHIVGTKNAKMYKNRAISGDENIIAKCIRDMIRAYGQNGKVHFVTKHFPGLGNASGNTDVEPRVLSLSTTKETMEKELYPYRIATEFANKNGYEKFFSAMISHASYTVLDAQELPGTFSENILKKLLRTAPKMDAKLNGVNKNQEQVSFNGMGFKGLAISDAFWTWGMTTKLSGIELNQIMLRSFIAGMDVLMIPQKSFVGAWDYFQAVYASSIPDDEKVKLIKNLGFKTWEELHNSFNQRLQESSGRIYSIKKGMGFAVDNVK